MDEQRDLAISLESMFDCMLFVACLQPCMIRILKEAYALSNLCSYARKYWRKAMDRGTSGEVGCDALLYVKCLERVWSEQTVPDYRVCIGKVADRLKEIMHKNPRKERLKQKKQLPERDPSRTRSGKIKRTKTRSDKNAEHDFDDDDIRIISVQRILVACRATALVLDHNCFLVGYLYRPSWLLLPSHARQR